MDAVREAKVVQEVFNKAPVLKDQYSVFFYTILSGSVFSFLVYPDFSDSVFLEPLLLCPSAY